jgi:8-oxo-dGTP pyrophosphatase MutT (NUDIX family)
MDCALREFSEETGYDSSKLVVMQNIIPYEEIFMGSNVKTYKHKYYVAYFPLTQNATASFSVSPKFQKTEVSKMAWFTFDECVRHIRPHNLEKINILRNLNNALNEYEITC